MRRWYVAAAGALAFACFVYGVIVSWHWPTVHDASIMHYVVLLLDHGMAPYRDIMDINMPGAYLTEWLAVHLLGPGDMAWRIFDLLEMLAAIAACCVITQDEDWRAGLLAGLLLDMLHIADGAIELGQRDWTMAVLLVAAYAFLLLALRRAQPGWMTGFAFLCTAAATIKPVAAPIPLLLLPLACIWLRRDGHRALEFLGFAAAGAACVTALFFGFLSSYHATGAFFSIVVSLIRFYSSIGNVSYSLIAKLALGRYVASLLLGALALSAACRLWRRRQHTLLLTGIVWGAWLYFAQHKGYAYHRLTLMAFVLLYLCWVAAASLRQSGGAAQIASAAVLALLMAYAVTHWTLATHKESMDRTMQLALERDLYALGGRSLSGSVQCLEMGSGCITDLYRMGLVQSTGFISDFFLFTERPEAPMQTLRGRLMELLAARPPKVIVLVPSDWAGGPVIYQPTDNWPEFTAWLGQHYRLAAERRASDGTIARDSYRLYARR